MEEWQSCIVVGICIAVAPPIPRLRPVILCTGRQHPAGRLQHRAHRRQRTAPGGIHIAHSDCHRPVRHHCGRTGEARHTSGLKFPAILFMQCALQSCACRSGRVLAIRSAASRKQICSGFVCQTVASDCCHELSIAAELKGARETGFLSRGIMVASRLLQTLQ